MRRISLVPAPMLIKLRVAQQSSGWVFIHVAIAAHGIGLASSAMAVALSDANRIAPAASLRDAASVIAGLSHRIDIGSCCAHRRVHIGELPLHDFEFADRAPELLRSCDIGTRPTSMQARMMPSGPPASTVRSKSSPLIKTFHPRSGHPNNRFSAGMRQFSNTSSQVLDPRIPSLSIFGVVRNPSKSLWK